jgi:hypothetical protein
VSFFEPPEPPPDMPEPAFERKPWWGAPTNELGFSTGSTRLWPESPGGGGGASTTQISFAG